MSLLRMRRLNDDKTPILGGNLNGNGKFLSNHGTVIKRELFSFNYNTLIGLGKPTYVTVGTFNGWSLPIYDSDNEELFSGCCVNPVWDGVTNPKVIVRGWIDTANTGKNFKLQVSWSHMKCDGTEVVNQSDIDVETSQATGTAAQYTCFGLSFTLDWVGQGVSISDGYSIRVRRIAADSDEIAGEFVVDSVVILIPRKSIGGIWT